MQKLNINEIFYSIQGEGYRVGTPNIFIRLTGCNKQCPFCDTDYNKGTWYYLGELREYIQQHFPCKNIIWTGGEPTLQLNNEITKYFNDYGYYQAIESNGINEIPDYIDYISISPKGEINCNIKQVNEIRLLYPYFFNNQLISNLKCKYDNLYLSPAFNDFKPNYDNINKCIQLIKENPKWKLSIQIHKLIDIK